MGSTSGSSAAERPIGPVGRGALERYKPDQGKWTRLGTLAGALALIFWGSMFLRDQLSIFEGEGIGALLITEGIPILVIVLFTLLAYWVVYVSRKSSDFMIATEGEMKKVNWTSKGELIGSTKVVIMFTVLLAIVLFVADFVFQQVFRFVGVLKVAE
jgi:preprotein translocase subunit SecE